MFSDNKQIDTFKELMKPAATINPVAAINSELQSKSSAANGVIDGLVSDARAKIPADLELVNQLESLQSSVSAQLSSTMTAANNISGHAGNMSANLTENVARFNAAIEVNKQAGLGDSSPCMDVLTSMGSIAGVASDLVAAGAAMVDNIVTGLSNLIDAAGNIVTQVWDEITGFIGDLASAAADLVKSLVDELSAQLELDNILKQFALSTQLEGWSKDPCLSVIYDLTIADDVKKAVGGIELPELPEIPVV